MRDYAELIKRLRKCEANCSIFDCEDCAGNDCEAYESIVFKVAADAIEELFAKIDELWTQLHVEGRSLISDLPPHGDLIDRDALMADGWRLYKGAIMHDGSYATYEMPLSNPGVIVVIPSNKERSEDA